MIITTESITKERAEQIYNEYSGFVYRTALFLMKSKTAAEDISQETFKQVFKKYHLYNSDKPIEPWIYTITINIARNMYRKHKWLSFIGHQLEPGNGDLIEEAFFKEHDKEVLWREINKLSHKSKELIVLHFYLDMKLIDIATVLNIPLGTCKSRLNSALTALRKNFKDSTELNVIEGGEYNGAS